jgi:hypothetical protein
MSQGDGNPRLSFDEPIEDGGEQSMRSCRGWGLRRSHFVIPSVNLTWADLAELKVAEGGQQITDNGLDSLVTSPQWSDESVRAAPLSQAILRVVRKLSLPASGSVQSRAISAC